MLKKTIISLLLCILLTSCSIPTIYDLELNKNETIYGGHHDICKNAYIEIKCKKGLKCKTVTTKPYTIKICLNPSEKVKEDLVYKNPYDNNETYILNKEKIQNNTQNNQTTNNNNNNKTK